MRQHISAGIAGCIFAVGLGLSGMTNANKVLNFLDVFGNWDPSLAFVMVGAIGVHALLWRLIKRLDSPIFSDTFSLPTLSSIGRPLVVGAALFGTGWGLSGYCPGPAVVSMVGLGNEALVFCTAMLLGIVIHKRTQSTK
jgi:uncharacterized membrane protein YedE/YeeE